MNVLWWAHLLCGAIAGQGATPSSGPQFAVKHEGILYLTHTNFEQAVSAHPVLLVHFQRPGCAQCRAVHREMKRVSQRLMVEFGSGESVQSSPTRQNFVPLHQPGGHGSHHESAPSTARSAPPAIALAQVDCSLEPELGREHVIRIYPTIKLILFGRALLYTGPRTADAMLDFVKRRAAPPVKRLADHDAAAAFVLPARSQPSHDAKSKASHSSLGATATSRSVVVVLGSLRSLDGTDNATGGGRGTDDDGAAATGFLMLEALGLVAMGAADGIDVRVGATVLDKEARDATTLRQRLGVDKAGLDRLLRAPALAIFTPHAREPYIIDAKTAILRASTSSSTLAAAITRCVDLLSTPPLLRLDFADAAAQAATRRQLLSKQRGVQLLVIVGDGPRAGKQGKQHAYQRASTEVEAVAVSYRSQALHEVVTGNSEHTATHVSFLLLHARDKAAVRFFGAESLTLPAILMLNISTTNVRRYAHRTPIRGKKRASTVVTRATVRSALDSFFAGKLPRLVKTQSQRQAPAPYTSTLGGGRGSVGRKAMVLVHSATGASFESTVLRAAAPFALVHLYVSWDWRAKAVRDMLRRTARSLHREGGLLMVPATATSGKNASVADTWGCQCPMSCMTTGSRECAKSTLAPLLVIAEMDRVANDVPHDGVKFEGFSSLLLFGPRDRRAVDAPAAFPLDPSGRATTATALLRFLRGRIRAARKAEQRGRKGQTNDIDDHSRHCCKWDQQEAMLKRALQRARREDADELDEDDAEIAYADDAADDDSDDNDDDDDDDDDGGDGDDDGEDEHEDDGEAEDEEAEDEGGDNDGRVDKEYNEATDSHDDTLKRRQKLAIGSMLGAGYDINPAASAAAAQGSPGGEAGHRMALLRELKERAAAATKPLEKLAVTFHNSLKYAVELLYQDRVVARINPHDRVTVHTYHSISWWARKVQESGSDMALPALQSWTIDERFGLQQLKVIDGVGEHEGEEAGSNTGGGHKGHDDRGAATAVEAAAMMDAAKDNAIGSHGSTMAAGAAAGARQSARPTPSRSKGQLRSASADVDIGSAAELQTLAQQLARAVRAGGKPRSSNACADSGGQGQQGDAALPAMCTRCALDSPTVDDDDEMDEDMICASCRRMATWLKSVQKKRQVQLQRKRLQQERAEKRAKTKRKYAELRLGSVRRRARKKNRKQS